MDFRMYGATVKISVSLWRFKRSRDDDFKFIFNMSEKEGLI
jgi:hypothetical protein